MADKGQTTILNVDDDAGRYVKSHMLRQAGYRVIEGATGQVALDLVTSERPSLVLLDVNLPDINGLEVCSRLKRDTAVSVLVLQISASSITTEDRIRALDAAPIPI